VSYSIRPLTIDDFQASMDLAMYAFRISLSDDQIAERKNNYFSDTKHRYGVFEGDQLCSQLLLHDYHFTLQGKPIAASGVASVSTWPEYRRHGYVAKLIEHAFIHMKKSKQIISVLHPFYIAFYRKFGYELLSQRVKNKMQIHEVKRVKLNGKIVREKNYIALKEMYDEYAKGFNGMLVRSESFWRNEMPNKKKGNIVIYQNENGKKLGYLISSIEGNILEISEFIALNKEGFDGLWSFIGQHDSMVQEVSWYSTIDDLQFTQFIDPRINREIEQYGMARIVDCAAFIEAYTFKSTYEKGEQSFYIQIEDKYAPWNNGLHELRINENGNGTLLKLKDEQVPHHMIIQCTINSFTAILFGYQTLSSLVWNGHITGEKNKLDQFNERLNNEPTQLIDFF